MYVRRTIMNSLAMREREREKEGKDYKSQPECKNTHCLCDIKLILKKCSHSFRCCDFQNYGF